MSLKQSDASRIAAEIGAALSDSAPTDLVLAESAFGSAEIARASHAFRRFIQLADNLAAEHGAGRVVLTVTEPASTGSAHWDAAIAALCEYRLNAESQPVPEWITARLGFPDEPWRPKTSRYEIPADAGDVPHEFLSRGILIEAASLVSV